MTLMALQVAADANQVPTNINLGVKATRDVKKFAKATPDVKTLKSTWPKINFSVALPGQI